MTNPLTLQPGYTLDPTSNFTFANANVTSNLTAGSVFSSQIGNTVSVHYGDGGHLANIPAANIIGQVANALIAGTVITNAQPNITSLGTLANLTVGNSTANTVFGNGTINANANITTQQFFIGNGYYLTGIPAGYTNTNAASYLAVYTGNLSAGNANLGNATSSNYFIGNGNLLTGIIGNAGHANYADIANSVTGANVSGQVGNALIAGTVYTNAQPNITSVGTLGNLSVTNTATIGNVVTTGYVSSANGLESTSSYPGPYTDGVVVDYVTGNARISAGAADGLNFYNGGVATNLLFSITSVGNLNLIANGSANLGNLVTANYFSGNGSSLTGVGAVTATTVTASSQPNITSVGNLVSLIVGNSTANVTLGNATITLSAVGNANLGNSVTSNYFIGSGNNLSNIQGGNVTGPVAYATTANSVAGANVSGQVGNALIAGTVYTNAQPNITSVGTLSSLSVTGNISSGNANLGNLVTANYFSGNGSSLTGITTLTNGNSNVIVNANSNVAVSVNGTSNVVVISNSTVNVTSTTNSTGNGTGAFTTPGGASITKDLYVGGNIYTTNLVSQNTTILEVLDPLVYLSSNTTYPYNYDVGFYSHFSLTGPPPGNGYQHTGLVRNYVDNAWYLFSNAAEPSGSTVDLANANLVLDTLKLGNVSASGNVNASGNVSGTYILGNGYYLTGITSGGGGGGANISNGTSYVNVATSGGNIVANVGGSTIETISSAGITVTGNANVSGNVSATFYTGNGYYLTGITAVSSSYSVSNGSSNVNIPVTNGNINFTVAGVLGMGVVTSTGINSNGYITAAGNINTPTGNIVANAGYFVGNGYYLTGIGSPSNIFNGTSNVNIPSGNGNITFTVNNVSNTAIFTQNGINVANYVNAAYFYGNGYYLTGVGSAVNVSSGTANIIVDSNNYLQMSANGTANVLTVKNTGVVATSIQVTGTSNLGSNANVTITGGSNGQMLTTDGNGNLSWSTSSSQGTIYTDAFTGTGIQTTFGPLSTTPTSVNQTTINYNGVIQLRSSYTLSGANIVFSAAPAYGASIEVTTITGAAPALNVTTLPTARAMVMSIIFGA